MLVCMPELPDIELYRRGLERHLLGRTLERLELLHPFLLRSAAPPATELEGRPLRAAQRLGKRLVLGFEGDLHLVLHLMIAGRLRLRQAGQARGRMPAGKSLLARFDFSGPSLYLTEAGTQRRASLFVVAGAAGLAAHDRGGLELSSATFEQFEQHLMRERRTLKRLLCDPSLFAGIGNAYSDEILHRARLSPLAHNVHLSPDERQRLFAAARDVPLEWLARLDAELAGAFPEEVTAFRPDMAVHGRFGQPCPVCQAPVQRIVYASNQCNYCPGCQTEGRILADRALSRLLKDDWPRSLEELSG
jgi:formamidopyrimidine-DNA glycosylase